MNARAWAVARTAGGAVILAVLVWRIGFGPLLAGIRSVTPGAAAAALAITGVTTLCAAWRWRIVARGLGFDIDGRTALGSYYRAMVINVTVPGGIVGDAHRAIDDGQRTGHLARSVRAVIWERTAGQIVQITAAIAVVVTMASPLRPSTAVMITAGAVITGLAAVTAGLLLAARRWPASRLARVGRVTTAVVRSDFHAISAPASAWPAIAAASLTAIAGHAAVFVIAARVVAPEVGMATVLPIAMLMLLAGAIPLHVAGWGPREGVAVWACAASGIGASTGLAIATTYGVLTIISCLPGAFVLLVRHRRGRHAQTAGHGRWQVNTAAARRGPVLPEAAVANVGQVSPHQAAATRAVATAGSAGTGVGGGHG